MAVGGLGGQTRAILWAQWRTMVNFYSRGNWGMAVLTGLVSAGWYGLAVAGAVAAAVVVGDAGQWSVLERYGGRALLITMAYWQVAPVLLATTGLALDLKRLTVYPVTRGQLFLLEVLLRFSTGIEVNVVLAGVAVGLWRNPRAPAWSVAVLAVWVVMNLLLSAGIRDMLGRVLMRRRARELAMLGLVMLAAAPQLVLVTGVPGWLEAVGSHPAGELWPWNLTARLVLGQGGWWALAGLLGWTGAAGAFGWWQFERGFRFDADAARTEGRREGSREGWWERLLAIPSLVLKDPLGALVEKELRVLTRAPRFRLTFIMGFSFGLVIWLPLGIRSPESFFAANYLAIVSFYALALLGEVSIWNSWGFDRGAAQFYYVAPVGLRAVMVAKNVVALVFVVLEVGVIAVVSRFLPLETTVAKMAEALASVVVVAIFLLAAGNFGSVLYPRGVDPGQWRAASPGRFQALLLVLYPAASAPVALAYLGRFAFDSEVAFWGVLGFGALLGGVVYWIALESAVRLAGERREQLLAVLSAREGPVTS